MGGLSGVRRDAAGAGGKLYVNAAGAQSGKLTRSKDRRGDGIEHAVVLPEAAGIAACFIKAAAERFYDGTLCGISGGKRNAGTEGMKLHGKALSDAAGAGDKDACTLQGDGQGLHGKKQRAFGGDGGIGKGQGGILQIVIAADAGLLKQRAECAESPAKDDGVFRQRI